MIRKFIFSAAVLLAAAGTSYAQSNSFPSSGNVGIGTTSPSAKLQVIGQLKVENANNTHAQFGNYWPLYAISNWPNVGFNAYFDGGWKYGAGSAGNYAGSLALNPVTGDYTFYGSGTTGNAGSAFANIPLFVIKQNGNVTIGNPAAATYKLTVEGSIGATALNIKSAGAKQSVFNNDYKLPPLADVEKHILTNKSLPGIASNQTDIELGQANKILVQKVEELTLYIIQQQSDIKALQQKVSALGRKK
ncbi:hypothetical protein [Chitinophaga nivalis]|uniref:BZIP transcription factor n=1 Tax=Chitinophaga nivalis TaxID=2991709 RepID=A0ABT3IS11_9BACT|nr:hypothetical protein [Chitinophaga nivalis]MCW3463533.1 hypothetical protein [Chitinophaga nivalis]MCW3486777.1 hypothetical protein [Chitinophaga nivalis]